MPVQKFENMAPLEQTLSAPSVSADGRTRLAGSTKPMLFQTGECTYVYNNETKVVEILCSDTLADKVHELDDAFCGQISSGSREWFGQDMSNDVVEKLFRPTLVGSRSPRVFASADGMKCFDSSLKPVPDLEPNGSAVFILECEGVQFEARAAETKWAVKQVRQCEASDAMFL